MEFKQNDKVTSIVYYSVFIIRRFVFALYLTLAQDNPAQVLAINIATAISVGVIQVFVFVSLCRPFDMKLDQVEAVINEGCIVMVYSTVSLFLFDLDDHIRNLVGELGTWIARAAMCSNVLFSAVKTGLTAVSLIQELKKRAQNVQQHMEMLACSTTQEHVEEIHRPGRIWQ